MPAGSLDAHEMFFEGNSNNRKRATQEKGNLLLERRIEGMEPTAPAIDLVLDIVTSNIASVD